MVYRAVEGQARMLRRGAAIFVIALAASGCSSSSLRFLDDGAPTASAAPSRPAQRQMAAAQPYPGDSALAPAYVDRTSTGSINRAAVEPATAQRPRFWQRAFRAPIPSRDVGNQPLMPQQASAQLLPPATDRLPPASYPSSQPFPAAAAGTVSRAPASDPVMAQPLPPAQPRTAAVPAYVDTTATGSIAPAAPARPAGASTVTARSGDTLRKVANRYGVSVDRLARANGLPADAALAAGQTLVVPAFVSDAAAAPKPVPAEQASLPAQAPTGNVPVPGKKPGNQVAVLPQQTRVEKPQQSAAAPAPSAGSVYVVQSGDTLSAIAKRHGTTPAAIRAANGMDAGTIRVGQKLVVPGQSATRTVAAAKLPAGVDPVVTGSTAPAGYTPPKKTEAVVAEAMKQAAAAPDATGIGKMRWPVRGKVVSGYGDTRGPKRNDGIDIAVPEGTPVKAAENGVVIYAGDGLKDFGNTVLVRHENGLVTVYGHASQILVSRGETVRRGQDIARSGVSGNADTPKLHFEVRKDSAPVNPGTFLE